MLNIIAREESMAISVCILYIVIKYIIYTYMYSYSLIIIIIHTYNVYTHTYMQCLSTDIFKNVTSRLVRCVTVCVCVHVYSQAYQQLPRVHCTHHQMPNASTRATIDT